MHALARNALATVRPKEEAKSRAKTEPRGKDGLMSDAEFEAQGKANAKFPVEMMLYGQKHGFPKHDAAEDADGPIYEFDLQRLLEADYMRKA